MVQTWTRGSEVVWLHRCRLGRESIRPKEYIKEFSVLGPQLFLGTTGSKDLWHSAQTEAEYMAASQATCEVIWMRKILVGLFGQMMDPTVIYCDNQSCIKLSENLYFMIDPSI
jgi:hypothetical protein